MKISCLRPSVQKSTVLARLIFGIGKTASFNGDLVARVDLNLIVCNVEFQFEQSLIDFIVFSLGNF